MLVWLFFLYWCSYGDMSETYHLFVFLSCTIQNCVVSEKVVIESGCNLNECHIGHGYKVAQNTKAKNELYSAN